jgi:hypothetical protein
MAEIKIVGNVVSLSNVSRYKQSDANLISSYNLKGEFGKIQDYIEFHIFDAGELYLVAITTTKVINQRTILT